MTTTTKHLMAAVALVAGLAAAGTASAQSTWNLLNTTCTPTSATPNDNERFSSGVCKTDGVSATVTAWTNSGSGGTFVSTYMSEWSGGVGVWSPGESGSPQHAIDNNGFVELIAVNFSAATKLTGLSIGWWSGDADVSVLRYTGSGTPDTTGLTTANLTSKGWALVASSDADPTGSVSFNGGGYSSWWLISSYFGAGGNAADGSGSLGGGNDYFKLLSLTGSIGSTPPAAVPEPGSLLLAGLALTGLVVAQRRGARRR